MSNSLTVFTPEVWVKDIGERFEEIINVYLGQVREKFLSLDNVKDYPNLKEGF